nr:MAG TPA: hypothetical protein [Caudoviricetes sp.]
MSLIVTFLGVKNLLHGFLVILRDFTLCFIAGDSSASLVHRQCRNAYTQRCCNLGARSSAPQFNQCLRNLLRIHQNHLAFICHEP